MANRRHLSNGSSEHPIFFHIEGLDFQLSQPKQIAKWIVQILEREHAQLKQLNFIFCDDAYLHQINLTYLQHDTYTDVITFPYQKMPIVEGDIFISVERIKENASLYGVSFEKELLRVIIHGVLHLCGYMDKTEEDKKRMTAKENEALAIFAAI